MSWNDQLVALKTQSSGCAIFSLGGDLYAQEGNWKATPAELKQYVTFFCEPSPALAGFHYGGQKLICNSANGEMVLAMKGKEAVVLQKTATLVVAGYTDGTFHPASLSGNVSKVAAYLAASNL